MNTSEDGGSPLGECPEYMRSGVGVLRAAYDKASAPGRACNEIRALHKLVSIEPGGAWCIECRTTWPCPTVAVLDRLGC